MIRPIHDHVAIRRVEEERKDSTIIIPDVAKEKPLLGEVVAVGSGRLLDSGTVYPMDIKVGDRVLVGKYFGSEVTIEGQELLLIREGDILAVITE